MVSSKRNGFQWKEGKQFPVKQTASTKGNGFHEKEWFPLKGTGSTKKNGFH